MQTRRLHALATAVLLAYPASAQEGEVGALAPMHGPLASFGAATTSDAIYVLGGHVGGAHEHSRENLSPRLVRYSLDDPSRMEELPGGVGLQSVALVAHGDHIYRVGGMYATNAPSEEDALHSVDVFARYDQGDWTSVAALPAERSSHDAIFLGETLYVFGGWRLDGEEQPTWFRNGLALDLSADAPRWTRIDQPFERRALAVATAFERIYVIGGLTPDGSTSSAVDIYDTRSGSWSRGPELPVSGFGATAFGLDDGVYFLGRDGNLWRLGEGASDWELVRGTAFPRFFARLVPAGTDRLAVIGGASPQGRPALLEVVPTRRLAVERPVVSSLSVPFPGDARQRHAAFIHKNRLYLFGGNRHSTAHRFDAEDFSWQGWSLDLLTCEWREEQPFPAARQSMRAVLVEGSDTAVVAGGFGPGEGEARSWSDVHLFDLVTRSWVRSDVELPLGLTQFGWLADGGALWTVGGVAYASADERDTTVADALFRWELGSEQGFVEAGAQLAAARRAFGWAAMDGSLYVVGGMDGDFDSVTAAERIELSTGERHDMASPAKHRLGPQAAALAGKLYVTSGTSLIGDGRAFDASLEVYDPLSDRWSTLVEELPVTAEHLRLLVWGERLVAFTTAREGWLDLSFVTPSGARPAGGGFRHP